MKEITIQKTNNPKKRTKILSIHQKCEDKNSTTYVRKNFVYMVFANDEMESSIHAPEIYIKKSFDTKKKIERFSFLVKGSFYINYNRQVFKVRFQHTLNIRIQWKKKIFSPKKSAVLT